MNLSRTSNHLNCSPKWLLHLLATLLSCAIANSSFAIVEGADVDCRDRRYDAVGIVYTIPTIPTECGGFISGSCTLIAPRIAIGALHSVGHVVTAPDGRQYYEVPSNPSVGGPYVHRVRFRRATNGNASNVFTSDCTGIFQEYGVVGYERLGGYSNPDLVLLYLDTPVDSNGEHTPVPGIAPIPVEPIRPDDGDTVIVAGWGKNGVTFDTGTWGFRYDVGTHFDYWVCDNDPCFCTDWRSEWVNDRFNGCTACNGTYDPDACSAICSCVSGPAYNVAWANIHDSGGAVLVARECSEGQELRLVGVITGVQGYVAITAWNRFRLEFGSPASELPTVPTCSLSCKADVNADGTVDGLDFTLFYNAWWAGYCIADWNGSGTVTSADMSAFIADYYACGGS